MIDGIDGLKQSMRALFDQVEGRAAPVAVKAGLDVLRDGVNSRTPVDSGALLAAEVETPVRDVRGFVTGSVSVPSDHAAAVEFGTTYMAAQPFMRPTIAADGPDAVKAMRNSLDTWVQRNT